MTRIDVQTLPTPEVMLETIVVSFARASEMRSSPLPALGKTVLIGSCYHKETLRLATIDKIDKRGVITVSDGTRFSTAYREIVSTRKVDNHFWSMFDLKDSYQQALKQNAEIYEAELRSCHRGLVHRVERLRSVEDAETIDKLLKVLEQESC